MSAMTAAAAGGSRSSRPLEERSKRIEVSKVFEQERQADLERITGDEGIQLRVNRSIQAEGIFAAIKEEKGFRRFHCRGLSMTETEIVLLCMACNVQKLHRKIQSGRTGIHLFEAAA